MDTENSISEQKIKLTIEYDGESYNGWQKQLDPNTIQGRLETVLETVLGKRHPIYGAGRTDSGVHAKGQVAHFFSDKNIPIEKWPQIFNAHLPASIRVQNAEAATSEFHAQKSARSKVYEYYIYNRRAPSALNRRVYHYPASLDWEAIRRALPYFEGTHDFVSFQGAKASVKTTIRTIYRLELKVLDDGLYCFEVEGSGFLKQMVRAIVGTLVEVGEGKRQPSEIIDIIAAKDRRKAGRTAPPGGLFLSRVYY